MSFIVSHGKDGSKGISCMVSHLKLLHICNDECKNINQEDIESDPDLFTIFEQTLRESLGNVYVAGI